MSTEKKNKPEPTIKLDGAKWWKSWNIAAFAAVNKLTNNLHVGSAPETLSSIKIMLQFMARFVTESINHHAIRILSCSAKPIFKIFDKFAEYLRFSANPAEFPQLLTNSTECPQF